MTAHDDEPQASPADQASEAETQVPGAPTADAKERFRAALEAKRAGQHARTSSTTDRDTLAGHAKDGAHGHRVFRRKSG